MHESECSDAPLPLEGVKVVELAQLVAGPSAAMLLADYGAQVFKFEPPTGDAGRQLRSRAARELDHSPVFRAYNRNKRMLRLNLRDPAAIEQIYEILADTDVLIESSVPGAMGRLGLGPETLRSRFPRLIYASISGFGAPADGSAPRRGVDMVVQAESGMMSITGFPDGPPTKAGFTVADAACGHALCHGILAALLRRQRTGTGEVVRVSLYDVALQLQTGPLVEYLETGRQEPRPGNSAPLTAPADLMRCRTGNIVVSAYIQHHWERFARAIDGESLIADPRFLTRHARVENRGDLLHCIEELLSVRDAEDWNELLQAAGVTVGMVKEYSQVAADPQSSAIVPIGESFSVRNPVLFDSIGLREPTPGEEDVAEIAWL